METVRTRRLKEIQGIVEDPTARMIMRVCRVWAAYSPTTTTTIYNDSQHQGVQSPARFRKLTL